MLYRAAADFLTFAMCHADRSSRVFTRPFARRRGAALAAVALAWLVAASAVQAAEPAPQAAPAIVLVSLDTTRADHLGAWGYAHARTPNLDALARRGVRFARCDTAAPITLPSHATILTGRYPPRHGVRDNAIFDLPASETTVAEVLAARGFETAAVVSATVLARHYGLAQGFARYDDRLGPGAAAVERRADGTTDAALTLLAGLERPYFLWVHYFDPHEPYAAPARWRSGAGGETPDYDAEIAFLDAELGRLLGALPSDARIIVVGDHGEMLGDAGEATHGLLLRHGARRVPLIVAGPEAKGGRRVDCLVRTADVAPTLLALAGVPASALADPAELDGTSLLPLAAGGACPAGSVTYSESFLPFFSYRWYPLRALSDGAELYVHGRRPALYDLAADAAERRDIAGERLQSVARWAERLASRLAAMGSSLETAPAAPKPLSDEEIARLASLGYVSSSAGGSATSELPDPRDMVDIAQAVHAAHALVDGGRCDEALPKLTAILRRDPSNVPALNQSGLCLQTVGRLRSALGAFTRAAEVNPQSAVPARNAGNVLVQLGELDKAEAAFARALKLDPRSPGVAANLANLRRVRGDTAGAEAALAAAEAAGSEHPGIALERGMIAAAAGDLEAALSAFELAVERAPDDPNALANAAQAAALLRRSERAVALYRRLLEHHPERADAWFGLASVLFQQLGDKVGAREALRQAIAHETDTARRARFEGYLRQLE